MITYRKFTGLLEAKEILTPHESDRLLERFKGDEWAILMYLVENTDIPSRKWGRLWGEAIGVAHVELRTTLFQSHVVRKLPMDFARKHMIIPLYKLGRVITVATANLSNSQVLLETEKLLDCRISPVFSLPQEIEYAVDVQYKTTGIYANGRWYTMDEALDLSGLEESNGQQKSKPQIREARSLPGTTAVTQDDIKKMLAEFQPEVGDDD